MMLNACRLLRGQEVVTRCLEELHGGPGLEGRRVRHVDDNLGVRQSSSQPFACKEVDARLE
jgi:hypothetical protein